MVRLQNCFVSDFSSFRIGSIGSIISMHDTTAMEVSSGILFLSAILKGRDIVNHKIWFGACEKFLFVRRKSANGFIVGRVKENWKKGTTVNLWCCISCFFANICILIRTIPVCPHHSKGLGVDSNTMVNISSVAYGISSPNCHIHCRFIG